jgi:hypothetical protein
MHHDPIAKWLTYGHSILIINVEMHHFACNMYDFVMHTHVLHIVVYRQAMVHDELGVNHYSLKSSFNVVPGGLLNWDRPWSLHSMTDGARQRDGLLV